MKKTYKKLLSFLTVICCLAGSLSPVHASGSGAVPRVVFENESDGRVDLYIGKEVVNSEGCMADPDDRFTFTLALSRGGAELTEEQSYRLCDLSGRELTKEELGVQQNAFFTQGGRFTLKAGQMARFSGISPGTDYVIREISKDGYTQIFPAGGDPVSGTKEYKTETFVFRNLYNPGGGGAAKLEVSKTVAFPDGYEVPQTQDFTFELKLEKKPAAGFPYKVIDSQTGRETDSRMTGEDGTFTLKGGQTAVFEGEDENGVPYIQDGIDYEVTETALPPGWRIAGDGETSKKGGINGTTLVSFHNSEASFAVTKRLEDYTTPDVDFRFELKKADGSLWAGVNYYLYDAQKNLVPAVPETPAFAEQPEAAGQPVSEAPVADQPEASVLENAAMSAAKGMPDVSWPDAEEADSAAGTASLYHTTVADGTFTLKPGQTAVFAGIEPGTVYSVNEIGNPEYIQTLPLATEGYTNQVAEVSVRTLPFVNKKAEYSRLLTVTKEVVNQKGDASMTPGGDVFHFILKDKDGKPVEHALYHVLVGSSEFTYYTGASNTSDSGDGKLRPGEFTLKANETARFQNLSPGDYTVEEIDLPPGYQIGEESKETQTLTLSSQGLAAFTFQNCYQSDKVDLQLLKTNPSGEPLAGAEFRLSKLGEGGSEEVIGTVVTDEKGSLSFEQPLSEGTWRLTETKTPMGYQLPAGFFTIKIERDENGLPKAPVVMDAKDNILISGADFKEGSLVKYTFTEGDQTRDVLTLTVKNEYLYSLPKTGGTGIGPYTLAGNLLILAAAFLYIRRWKTRQE